jgi:UDP-N-acetylmuramate--alanine ligase
MSDAQPWIGRRLHFVGIGGSGMSGWAHVAAQLGASVTGSDRNDSPALDRLRAEGIPAVAGHAADNLPDGEGLELVVSTAVPADNPELVAARERGLVVHPRADLLHELSSLRRTIAVAGAHGKTTTTAMTAHALRGAGLDPGYLIGGALRATGRHAEWGTGEWLVIEADESDRSMLALDVDVAVVTNVELDHHATYGSLEEVREVFRTFLHGAPEAILWDRPDVLALRDPADGATTPFDVPAPDLSVAGSRFDWRGHEVRLGVPGAHNARNAVAALEACRLAGADLGAAVAALATFEGAGRRFETLGHTPAGARVVDDYAHHPTEVAATLRAARTLDPPRLVAIFQPHLYSRTQRLAHRFGEALAIADVVAVVDVYPARERPEDFPGVDGRTIAAAVVDAAPGKTVLWLPQLDVAERVLPPLLRPDDLVLVLGAGNVDGLGRALVA